MSRSFRIDPAVSEATKQEQASHLERSRRREARKRKGRTAFNFIQDRKAERREIA